MIVVKEIDSFENFVEQRVTKKYFADILNGFSHSKERKIKNGKWIASKETGLPE